LTMIRKRGKLKKEHKKGENLWI